MQGKKKTKKIIILLGDIIVLYFSLYLALLIRYGDIPDATVWMAHAGPFTFIFALWIVIFYISGLYDLRLAQNDEKFFRSTITGTAIAAAFSVLLFYTIPGIEIAPKTNLIIHILIFTLLFYWWRKSLNWSLASKLPKKRIVFIGFKKITEELIEEIKQKPQLGYEVTFVADNENIAEEKVGDVPVIHGFSDIDKIIEQKNADLIVLAADPHHSPELRNILFNCLKLKISFINLIDFYEEITGRIPLESISQMWFLENLNESNKRYFYFFKRLCDVTFSLLALLPALPFLLFVAAVIKLESKGPAIFSQERLGQHGKVFKTYKFRTMTATDFIAPTTKNDNRITKIGSFLRKTRIDEIPQLFNVLGGEMSLIGPRPERPELATELEKKVPFFNERLLVKPGITGWDQISGEYHSPSVEDTLKKLQYDLFYIKNRSIYLDLSIILKTTATILSKSGL